VLEPCVSRVIATARLPDASLLTNGGSLSRPSRRRRSPGAKLRWANAPFSSSTPAGEALLRMTPSGILSFSRSSQRMPLSSTMSPRFNSFAATSTPSVVGGGGAAAICGGFDSLARTAAVIPANEGNAKNYETSCFHFHCDGLPVICELRIIALRAVASSFPDATPRRTAQDWKRITTLERQPRLKKIVSISFFIIKA
jgi:hypothetical protein